MGRLNPPPKRLRIALAADGLPLNPRTNSGVARGLALALRDHPDVASVWTIDGELRGAARYLTMVTSARTTRARWRAVYTKGPISVAFRSRLLDEAIARLPEPPHLVIQLRNVYRPSRYPYAVFIDNTAALTQAAWPPWALPPRELKWRLRADREQFAHAEHVFTAGAHVARHVVDHYGIPSGRVTPIGGGVNYDVGRVPPRAPATTPTVLFVGSESERKGVDVLLAAFELVTRTMPEARLALVGRNVSMSRPWLRPLGAISDRNVLSDLYRSAAAFCLPARFEPYGLVLLEAMAHGAPCVATSIGAIPEILGQGEYGLLVPPEDPVALAQALLRVLQDKQLQEVLSACARARVAQELTWDAVAARLLTALGRQREGSCSE